MPSRNNSSESRVPAWVWVFTGAILGAFVMFLVKLSEVAPPPSQGITSTDDSSSKSSDQLIPITFYEKLKENTPFELPEITEQKKTTPSSEAEKVNYLVQVASFKSDKDAEQLRVELIMLGLTEAHTRKAKIGKNDIRHRVLVGPLTTKAALENTRKTLLDNRYDALVLKQKL